MELTLEKKKQKTATENLTGSHAVVRSLLAEGVEYIFGYPGGAIMPVYDAFYDYEDKLKHILTRHEQGATHAAQGYARVSGKVGVCIATSGPGATNLITGLADAMIDSTPMVAITGQVASHLLGTDAFQETDVVGISMPVTKWNVQVTKAADIPAAMAKAFYIAKSGRPGPVLVDITKDAQLGNLAFEYKKCNYLRSYLPQPTLDYNQVEVAANAINAAKKPMVIVGQGVILSGAEKQVLEFAKTTGAAITSTLLGLSAFPSHHPQYFGMVGMHGNYAPNKLTNECDVLIAIGMRFDDRVTGDLSRYAKQAKVVHIELDPSEINKNVHADFPVLGDALQALTALNKCLKKNNHPAWLAEFRKLADKEDEKVIQGDLFPVQEALTMGEVVRSITDQSNHKAVLVTDVGQHQMIASRYFKFKTTRSNITSGGLGTMGFALPAAFGATLGAPHRGVVAIIGDGGFQMTVQELGTVFQTGTPVKVVVLNNSFLGMVRQWQEMFFDKRYASTEMVNPDFQMIAKGYGMKTKKVEKREDLDGAVGEMLAHNGAYFLEVIVEKEGSVFPMVPTGAAVSEVILEKP